LHCRRNNQLLRPDERGPSPSVRANFKLAYSKTSQDHEFSSAGLVGAPAGVGSLDGEVSTTLAQVRVVANPIPKLSVVGEFRYEEKEDDTPIIAYNQVGTTTSTNQTTARETASGKLEASYRFPWAIQGMAGLGFTSIDRSYTSTAAYNGVSALRTDTDETSWWIQVRRSMTERISGLFSYTGSSRDGSNWLAPAPGGVGLVNVGDPLAQLGPNAIYMPTLADRDRSKFRLLLNWMATDALSVQFAIDWGKDEYDAPTQYALQESRFDLYTLDVNYALSDAWNINGYLSSGKQKLNQARPAGYILEFDDSSFNVGVGFTGKPGEKLQVGGSLSWISNEDKSRRSVPERHPAARSCSRSPADCPTSSSAAPNWAVWKLCVHSQIHDPCRCRVPAADLRRLGFCLWRNAVPVQRQFDGVPAAGPERRLSRVQLHLLAEVMGGRARGPFF
jgi:MtrB/PioB family decaheme-associated outer membrane protein